MSAVACHATTPVTSTKTLRTGSVPILHTEVCVSMHIGTCQHRVRIGSAPACVCLHAHWHVAAKGQHRVGTGSAQGQHRVRQCRHLRAYACRHIGTCQHRVSTGPAPVCVCVCMYVGACTISSACAAPPALVWLFRLRKRALHQRLLAWQERLSV